MTDLYYWLENVLAVEFCEIYLLISNKNSQSQTSNIWLKTEEVYLPFEFDGTYS